MLLNQASNKTHTQVSRERERERERERIALHIATPNLTDI